RCRLSPPAQRLSLHTSGFWLNGAAPESNRASRGLHDLTGFEDRLGHRARPLRCKRYCELRAATADGVDQIVECSPFARELTLLALQVAKLLALGAALGRAVRPHEVDHVVQPATGRRQGALLVLEILDGLELVRLVSHRAPIGTARRA